MTGEGQPRQRDSSGDYRLNAGIGVRLLR